jgi:hypothetical protein
MRLIFKILNGLMAGLFLFAAALQYNDDDMLRWMAIYLAAATPCVLVILGRMPRWLPGLVLLVALGWSAIYFSRGAWSVPFREMFAEWEMKNQQVVETREMCGLFIVGGWMLLLVLTARWAQVKPARA